MNPLLQRGNLSWGHEYGSCEPKLCQFCNLSRRSWSYFAAWENKSDLMLSSSQLSRGEHSSLPKSKLDRREVFMGLHVKCLWKESFHNLELLIPLWSGISEIFWSLLVISNSKKALFRSNISLHSHGGFFFFLSPFNDEELVHWKRRGNLKTWHKTWIENATMRGGE